MDISIRIKLANRIKDLRRKNRFTQERLSELTAIDYKYIQRIEGKNPPNLKLETLQKIAKAFNITLSKLLEFR